MGKKTTPQRRKLVIGMLARNKELFDSVEEFFIKYFGEIDYKSPILAFNYTDYYKEEMGSSLKRKFISFRKLISPDRLSKIKLKTNLLEKKFSIKEKGCLNRCINIDPGYISDAKFILASTKDFFHRIYLGRGIYGEITLVWKKGGFESFEWTYPDYRTKEYIEILSTIREMYMKERVLDAR